MKLSAAIFLVSLGLGACKSTSNNDQSFVIEDAYGDSSARYKLQRDVYFNDNYLRRRGLSKAVGFMGTKTTSDGTNKLVIVLNSPDRRHMPEKPVEVEYCGRNSNEENAPIWLAPMGECDKNPIGSAIEGKDGALWVNSLCGPAAPRKCALKIEKNRIVALDPNAKDKVVTTDAYDIEVDFEFLPGLTEALSTFGLATHRFGAYAKNTEVLDTMKFNKTELTFVCPFFSLAEFEKQEGKEFKCNLLHDKIDAARANVSLRGAKYRVIFTALCTGETNNNCKLKADGNGGIASISPIP